MNKASLFRMKALTVFQILLPYWVWKDFCEFIILLILLNFFNITVILRFMEIYGDLKHTERNGIHQREVRPKIDVLTYLIYTENWFLKIWIQVVS